MNNNTPLARKTKRARDYSDNAQSARDINEPMRYDNQDNDYLDYIEPGNRMGDNDGFDFDLSFKIEI